MKKLMTTLLVLSVAGAVMAAPTYTEQAAKRAVAPVAKKEAAATHKAVQTQKHYQGQKDAAARRAVQAKKDYRDTKREIKAVPKQNEAAARRVRDENKAKVDLKKKQVNDLKKF